MLFAGESALLSTHDTRHFPAIMVLGTRQSSAADMDKKKDRLDLGDTATCDLRSVVDTDVAVRMALRLASECMFGHDVSAVLLCPSDWTAGLGRHHH